MEFRNSIEIRSDLKTYDTDKNLYLVCEIVVDGERIVDFSYYATSLSELKATGSNSGEFYILTCWCGEPSCAGIDKGIQVLRQDGVVQWVISEPLPKRTFLFEVNEYDYALSIGIEQFSQDVADLKSSESSDESGRLIVVPGHQGDLELLDTVLTRTKKR